MRLCVDSGELKLKLVINIYFAVVVAMSRIRQKTSAASASCLLAYFDHTIIKVFKY